MVGNVVCNNRKRPRKQTQKKNKKAKTKEKSYKTSHKLEMTSFKNLHGTWIISSKERIQMVKDRNFKIKNSMEWLIKEDFPFSRDEDFDFIMIICSGYDACCFRRCFS